MAAPVRRQSARPSFTNRAVACGVVAVLAAAPSARAADDRPVLGVLGALSVEVEELQKRTADRTEHTVGGVRFVAGTLDGRRVVVAHSGVGGVNAAVATALMIERFKPARVLFTGVAGGLNPDLRPLDIVVGGKTVQHDFGEVGPKGFRRLPTVGPADGKPNPFFFPADPVLLAAAEQVAKTLDLAEVPTPAGPRRPRVVTGVIVTGNVFVAAPATRDELRRELGADAAEMEGAATAQVCYQNRVPCLVVRSLSDDAGAGAADTFRKFERAAAGNSARLVAGIAAKLDAK